jgi:hypothetical protein
VAEPPAYVPTLVATSTQPPQRPVSVDAAPRSGVTGAAGEQCVALASRRFAA